tara:strand:+ start:9025 stop:9891 length:867 start_codon:yes stop_codon:yes gene_type:complete
MSEESVKNEMGNLEDVLGIMDRVNEVFSYEVWVPSLKKNVMFREINTNQQKRLIKAIIDSPVYNTEFIFALRKVISENCVDSKIDVDSLTILDKLLISMKMRSVCVGDVIELEIPTGDGDKSVKRGISLEKLIGDIRKTVNLPDVETYTDDRGIYQLECGIPTILNEYNLETEMRTTSESRDINNYDELRQSVGDVFIGEIAKYVRGLSITEGDKTTKIDLNALSFRNRIALIEKIPERITKDVIKYIEKTKLELDKVTLVKVDIGTKDTPDIKEEKFAIDGGFFTSS